MAMGKKRNSDGRFRGERRATRIPCGLLAEVEDVSNFREHKFLTTKIGAALDEGRHAACILDGTMIFR